MIDEVSGRADDLRKIRGVLFTPVSVEELVRAEFPEVVEYEIIVKKRGVMDEISLRVEPSETVSQSGLKDMAKRLSERLKIRTNLTFLIDVAEPGALPRYTLKAKRFRDLRGEGGTA